ncbi:MAG: ATP-binding protein [Gammaproteobacteria bacterium]
MKSIQSQLLWSILASAAVLLLAAGLVLESLLRAQLEREFDRNLLTKAMTLVTLTEQEVGQVEFEFEDEFLPQFSSSEDAEYFQLWLDTGQLIARSPSLGSQDLPFTNPPLNRPRFDDIQLPDGRDGRLVEIQFVPRLDDEDEDDDDDDDDDDDEKRQAANGATGDQQDAQAQVNALLTGVQAVLALAVGRENLDELILSVRLTLLLTMLGVLGAAGVIVRFAVRRGLRPLHEVARWVEDMDADTLDARIRLSERGAELAPITNQLNNLLGRLDDAFEREKHFSGNVAHELRTPLAELRSLADVGNKWPEDRKLVTGFFDDVGVIADNMERVVTNLLALTRCDAGKLLLEEAVVDLGVAVNQAWLKVAAGAKTKRIVLKNGLTGRLLVRTDPAMLELMVLNLMTNAVEYSPPGSAVSVSAHQDATTVTLAITNIAHGLKAEDLPSMFERFWRKESSRTGGHHAGLGLSLVKALANVLKLGVSPKLDHDHFSIALTGLQPG